MRILFCDNTCPGRFGTLPVKLAAGGAHEVMFLSFYPRDEASTPGVVHARLRLDRSVPPDPDPFLEAWHRAFRLARQACRTFRHIRESGFVPDMVCVTFSDGPALFLREVFPEAFIVSYPGVIRTPEGEGVEKARALLDVQTHQLLHSDLVFVRSQAQKRAFPSLLHERIHVQPPYVDTEFFSPGHGDVRRFFPDAPADAELVTFHMKGAKAVTREWTQLILGLLVSRPSCRIALSFGNSSLRERWLSHARSLPNALRRRLFLAGGLDRESYRDLLCLSRVHVFPECADPPLQEMLESMSCETLPLMPLPPSAEASFLPASAVPSFSPFEGEQSLAELSRILDNPGSLAQMAASCRRAVSSRCNETASLEAHVRLLFKAYEQHKASGKNTR